MENAALREREALAVERRNREVAEALELRDQERERADGEAALRSDLEAELQHLRGQLGESRAGWEEARTNLGVVAAACREADAKSRELQEHRRVLAREVFLQMGWGGGVGFVGGLRARIDDVGVGVGVGFAAGIVVVCVRVFWMASK